MTPLEQAARGVAIAHGMNPDEPSSDIAQNIIPAMTFPVDGNSVPIWQQYLPVTIEGLKQCEHDHGKVHDNVNLSTVMSGLSDAGMVVSSDHDEGWTTWSLTAAGRKALDEAEAENI